ncbi:MAG: hypothetical protein J5951_03070, partial [Bacteroidales bacterium]|nr:hypothetical protein [Bacteroidales bacterium]
MRHRLLPCMIAAALSLTAAAQYLPVQPNPYGERPVIVPVPTTVAGVAEPVVSLADGWQRAQVPGTTGISLLTRTVPVPAVFTGRRIILRFDNTTQAASLSVNGHFVRNYWGVSGAWTADITDFVTPGEEALVAVRLERSDGLGAFVRFQPVIREARLYAVPEQHLQRLRLTTTFDTQYRDAELEVWVKVSEPGGGSLRLSAVGADGKALSVSPASIRLPAGMAEFKYKVNVQAPRKWDA